MIDAVEGDLGSERLIVKDRRGRRSSIPVGDVVAAKVWPAEPEAL